ncbi:MAG: circadian clock KaiB family protein [Aquabacterium sp.]
MKKRKILLKLYISGNTPNSIAAISNLRSVCETQFPEKYQIAIIDILERPQAAEDKEYSRLRR